MDKFDKKEKIWGVQSFRDLLEEGDAKKDSVYSGLLWSGLHTSPAKQVATVWTLLQKLTQDIDFLHFLTEVISYVSSRLRFLFVIITVFGEVISGYLAGIKRLFVRNLFWGRGKVFRHSMQAVTVFLLVMLLIVGRYRGDIVDIVEASNWEDDRGDVDNSVARDLLVQNASTSTQVPEGRARIGIVEYVVKGGDSIAKIANFFGVSEETLRWANDLSMANIIHPGDVLKIPPGDGVLREVEKGDTLDTFAMKYKRADQELEGVKQSIVDANWMDPPFDLREGQELFIPDGVIPEAERFVSDFSGIVVTEGSKTKYSSYVDPDVGRFLDWPVKGGAGNLSQCYHGYHNGVDIAHGGMPDLVAAADGTVTFAGCHSGSCPKPGQKTGGSGAAWAVEIDHGNGFVTIYAHMNSIYVRKGDKVKQGDTIGQMGMSGTATGVHVHFMLWKGGRWNVDDPAKYMVKHICGY